MRTLLAAAAVTTTLLTLSACGGGGDDDPQDAGSSQATESVAPVEGVAAETVLRKWIEAYDKPAPAAVCALQTEKYTQAQVQASIADGLLKPGATCEDVVVAIHELADKADIDFTDGEILTVSTTPEETLIRLTYLEPEPSATDFLLVREGDSWLIDEER